MSLKNLQEISSLVTNNLKLPPFSGVDEGSKYLRLLAGIAENRWEDESEARQELYGKSLDSRSFDMLKSRAKEHLVNMIFQLDTEKTFKSSLYRAYHRCCKNVLSGNLFFTQYRLELAKSQLQLALTTARKYHFTDMVLLSLRRLRHIASLEMDKTMFKNYSKEIERSQQIIQCELECESYEHELIMDVLSMAKQDEIFAAKAKQYFETTKSYLKQHDTYTLRMNYYRIGFRYFNSTHQYKNTMQLAGEAIEYLNKNKLFKQKIRLGEMSLNKLHATQQIRDYREGNKVAKLCNQLFDPGTLNWMIYLETYFMLCIQTHKYNEAWRSLNKVVTNIEYAKQFSDRIEKWRMYEAYLHYIYDDASAEKKKFNLYKFLNEVPIYSKDKAGYNVSILIAQVLLLLKGGDYDKILSRAESLKVYISRHVKRENSPRTYYFLKMLLVMIKYEFDPEKTEQIAQKFFDRMQEKGGNREIEEMEVIPYDILWPQVLKMLRDQEHEHIKPVK